MRKAFTLALLLAIALPFTAQRAQAQFSLIPQIGYNLDAEALLVGIGTEFVAPFEISNFDLAIRPAIEYIFVDSGDDITQGGVTFSSSVTSLQINGDLIARLNATNLNPFVGAGLAVYYTSVDNDCDGSDLICGSLGDSDGGSNTDIGLNLLGGLEFPGVVAFGDPYVQARITFADGTAISLLGGIIINLGAN